MSLAELVPPALQGGIVLVVFSIGLNAWFSDEFFMLRHPFHLMRALLAMLVIVPLCALLLAIGFDLHPVVKITLFAMAISPVAPFLPLSQLKAGGHAPYVIELLVASSLFAILFVPMVVALVGRAYGIDAHMPLLLVAKVVSVTVLLPLAAGIALHHLSPALAAWLVKPVMGLVVLLLAGSLVAMLISLWPVLGSVLDTGTLAAIVALMIAGMAAGHVLGGPDEADRTALLMACVARHPAVALANAELNFPQQHAVTAAVLLMLILGATLPTIYLKLCGRYKKGASLSSKGQ